MVRRIGLLLAATTLAVTGVAAAASASTGAPAYSPEQAGYAATGAHFKVAEVWVKLPDASRFAHELGSLSVSVQLWTAASVMDLRASACTDTTCRPGGKPVTRRYHLDFTVFSRSTGAPVCSTSNKTCPGVPASWNSARFAPGRTMALSLFYDPKAGSFFASANSQSYDNYFPGPGLIFNQARIGVETGATPWSRTPFRAPAAQVRLATFGIPPGPAQAAEIASYSGRGSCFTAPWWTAHQVRMTGDGTSAGVVRARPQGLSNHGCNFSVYLEP